ncbi:MAG: hypothetical protein NZM13_05535 [Cyclobacteriaceae bacterium]|nr:hypothetical protein [Cyclobacteriaceae bacterium]MDW8331395.1 hypothetical protein [Cyclobacteriaceae bacterium]
MLKKLSFIGSSQLQQEKQKDYRNVVIIQVTIIVLGLLLSGPLLENPRSEVSKLIITVFSFFGALYAFLLWDLLRNFTRNNTLIISVLLILIALVIFGMLIEFPYFKIIQIENRRLALFIIHGILFPIEVLVIVFTIRDIFFSEFLTPDKLWGSACVFLMTGISFGSLYDLICISGLGSLGVDLELGIPNYAECVGHSLSLLGGIDSRYPEASYLIKNLGVIEGLWGSLFTVLIIGKLLGLPKPTDPKESKQNPEPYE